MYVSWPRPSPLGPRQLVRRRSLPSYQFTWGRICDRPCPARWCPAGPYAWLGMEEEGHLCHFDRKIIARWQENHVKRCFGGFFLLLTDGACQARAVVSKTTIINAVD
jgi:hypothetical protein